jgi:hypothetical protein
MSGRMSRIEKIIPGREAITLSFAVLAFMRSTIDLPRAHSEQSVLAQKCNDDGGRRAVIEPERENSSPLTLGSCVPRTVKDTGVSLGRQVLSMRRVAVNTQNAGRPKSLLAALSGMNSDTYSACIESLDVYYRVMFVHLTTSNSIHAVDDLQSN